MRKTNRLHYYIWVVQISLQWIPMFVNRTNSSINNETFSAEQEQDGNKEEQERASEDSSSIPQSCGK